MSITDAYLSILAKRITSNEIQNSYNLKILKTLDVIYSLANTCRNQGKDSTLTPESELTLDMAERIDRMLKTPIAERLRELLDKYTPEQTAIIIADEIATGKFGFLQPNQILDLSVRVGLAIITEGLTIAPLQGISSVKIKANEDSSKYVAVSFAAPIRIIGSIHAAFSLVIADRVRKTIGLDNYRANAWGQDEVGRMIEELRIYEKNFTDLQFHVSDNDIRKTISHIPVQIDGVDTSQIEVVTHRAMKRIETDRIRGG
ncbi:MAG TPA: DNA polymerase II large subunit, partial [Nitrososphaerales archaeon]